VLFLPNLLWNVQYHFPFLELQENIRRYNRNVSLSLAGFFGEEVLSMLPLSAPVWIDGLWALFRGPYRALALAWVIAATLILATLILATLILAALILAALILAMSPRVYYLFPAFPMLLAARAVQFERWRAPRFKAIYCALTIVMAVMIAPTLLSLRPPETYIRYAAATHLQQPRIENRELDSLPQLCRPVRLGRLCHRGGAILQRAPAGDPRAYRHLRPELRASWCDRSLRHSLRLAAVDRREPKLISLGSAQLYRREHDRDGRKPGNASPEFTPVEKVGRVESHYAMPYDHLDIHYCRGLKHPLAEIWPQDHFARSIGLQTYGALLQERVDRDLRDRFVDFARGAAARDRADRLPVHFDRQSAAIREAVGEDESAQVTVLQRFLGHRGRAPVDRRVLCLLLREGDRIQRGMIGLLQEEQIAAFVHDADSHVHVALLRLGLRGRHHGFDRRQVQKLARRQVRRDGHKQCAE
jgi:hypothetical protein